MDFWRLHWRGVLLTAGGHHDSGQTLTVLMDNSILSVRIPRTGSLRTSRNRTSDLTECELAMLSWLAVMKSMWSQTRIGRPDDPQLRHVSVVGDTYMILVPGAQTTGRFCLIDMLCPTAAGRRRTAIGRLPGPSLIFRSVLAAITCSGAQSNCDGRAITFPTHIR